MSKVWQRAGWWMASDGKSYSPELHTSPQRDDRSPGISLCAWGSVSPESGQPLHPGLPVVTQPNPKRHRALTGAVLGLAVVLVGAGVAIVTFAGSSTSGV